MDKANFGKVEMDEEVSLGTLNGINFEKLGKFDWKVPGEIKTFKIKVTFDWKICLQVTVNFDLKKIDAKPINKSSKINF